MYPYLSAVAQFLLCWRKQRSWHEAAVTLCSQPGSTAECAVPQLALLISAWDSSLWDGTGRRGRKMSKAFLLHARHCAMPATAMAKKHTFFSPSLGSLERKKDGRRAVESR